MKKKNTLKRILSVVLMLSMLITVTSVFTGCGLFTKKITGTEAAKILLAHERLDSDYIGQKTNIMTFSEANTTTGSSSGGFFSKLFGSLNIGASALSSVFRPTNIAAAIANGTRLDGNTVYWDLFDEVSTTKTSYQQFIEPIEKSAMETAELIVTIKENVGVTDVWVEKGEAKYMLLVGDNYETIIKYIERLNSTTIYTRYTADDARCIYEIYHFETYENGEDCAGREICIPGEYYEYATTNTNGFCDYFVANKSSGQWITYRFSDPNGDGAFFDVSNITDTLGYNSYVSAKMGEDGNWYFNVDSSTIFSPNSDRDYFMVNVYDTEYNISIDMSNIMFGISSLSCDTAYTFVSEYTEDIGDAYRTNTGNEPISINLKNGNTIAPGNVASNITYNGGNINYNAFFGKKSYVGVLNFTVTATSFYGAYTCLMGYLESNGITLFSDEINVENAYENSKYLAANVDVLEWNGYKLSSLDNLIAAEQVLYSDLQKYRDLCEEVWDNETIILPRKVADTVDFGKMSLTSSGTSTYSNGVIYIQGLSASASASDILVEGTDYTIKIGLAKRDNSGAIASVNTVSLDSTAAVSTVTYTGDDLFLVQNGEYIIPTALSAGEYVVVAYFATAEEGIRVTEMYPIAFYSADEGELDATYMNVSVKMANTYLYVDYEIKLTDYITADFTKTSYTYEEIKNAIMRGILNKGYPMPGGAMVERENGEVLSSISASYSPGTYRMKYLANTPEGMVEAYMYCTFN